MVFGADVRDQAAVATAVAGADAVVDAVSAYVETAGVTFEAVHERGAAMLAREATAAGVTRFVLVSDFARFVDRVRAARCSLCANFSANWNAENL